MEPIGTQVKKPPIDTGYIKQQYVIMIRPNNM